MLIQVTFRNMTASPALRAAIEAEAESLLDLAPNLTRCKVVVEAPHRRHAQGEPFHVRLDVLGPRLSVFAGGRSDDDPTHANPYLAVREAFDAARRALSQEQKPDHSTIRRGALRARTA